MKTNQVETCEFNYKISVKPIILQKCQQEMIVSVSAYTQKTDWAKSMCICETGPSDEQLTRINRSFRVTCVSKTEHIQTNLFYPKTNPSHTTIHISHMLQPAVKQNSGHQRFSSSGKPIDTRNLVLEIWHPNFGAAVSAQTFSLRVYLDLTVFDEHFMNSLESAVVELQKRLTQRDNESYTNE